MSRRWPAHRRGRPPGRASRFRVGGAGGPVAMAHRGFSRDGLENSLAAFAAAVDLGCDTVETDVHATSDGVLVAFHDDRLDRVTDSRGMVAELPWAVVSRARIGGREPVPRLLDVLERWPDLRLNIDVKAAGAVRPLADLLLATGAHDRVCVASFSDRRRLRVLLRLPRGTVTSAGAVLTAVSVVAVRVPLPGALRRAVLRLALSRVDAVQVPRSVATPAYVRAVRAGGTAVHVWTVDDPEEMRFLLGLGVDGLVTDRADLLRDVLLARGQWPPPAGRPAPGAEGPAA